MNTNINGSSRFWAARAAFLADLPRLQMERLKNAQGANGAHPRGLNEQPRVTLSLRKGSSQ